MASKLATLFVMTAIFLTGCSQLPSFSQHANITPLPSPTPIPQVNTTNITNSTPPPPPPIIVPPLHLGNLTAYYLNVGQGDADLIIGPNNETMLIDCGPVTAGSNVVQFVRNLGISTIDALVVSHLDADHMGGCPVEIFKLKPKTIYDNGRILTNENYTNYQKTWTNNHKAVSQDGPFNFDILTTNLLVPYDDGNGFSGVEDENSVLIKLSYGTKSFLFAGDCTSDCEARVLNSNIKSDALKVAMGGLSNATSVLFLNAVMPSIAVISGNNPSPDTLVKLSQRSITTYRTDQDGTIVVTTDGKTVGVEKVKG